MFDQPLICLLNPYSYFFYRLIADSQGITVYKFFRKQVIPWGRVSDYYFELPTEENSSRSPLIIIEYNGQKLKVPGEILNFQSLVLYIEDKAKNANATKFKLKQSRDLVDSPQTFEYDVPPIASLVFQAVRVWLFAIFGLVILDLTKSGIRGLLTLPGKYPFEVWAVIALIAMIEPAIVLSKIPRIRKARAFSNQKITVTNSNIEWREGANKIEVPWQSVRNYHLEPMGDYLRLQLCVVETGRERITFLSTIKNVRLLQSLIAQKATNARTQTWDYALGYDEDSLKPPILPDANGITTFHYRTRANRLPLMIIVPLYFITAPYFYFTPSGSLASNITSALIVGTPMLYFTLAYFFWRIEVGPEGLRYITLFNRTYIGWSEVQKLNVGDTFFTITSNHKKIRILRGVAIPFQFQEIVSRRSQKAWEKPK